MARAPDTAQRRAVDIMCAIRARRDIMAPLIAEISLTKSSLTPFHIAVQVRDIAEARHFYRDILGCPEGRSAAHWVDFNLYGHQFVCHLNPGLGESGKLNAHFNPVDDQSVPVPHCGVVLRPHEWSELAQRL